MYRDPDDILRALNIIPGTRSSPWGLDSNLAWPAAITLCVGREPCLQDIPSGQPLTYF
jgi:hypothetical protein